MAFWNTQVPYLEVDGQRLAQSQAIARYLARKYNLAGQTAWEEAQVDAIAAYVEGIYRVQITFISNTYRALYLLIDPQTIQPSYVINIYA